MTHPVFDHTGDVSVQLAISAQNIALPTASLAATERVTTKPMMIDDEWVDVRVIRSGLYERPADGSVTLLEAVTRARAVKAYERIFGAWSGAAK